MFTRQARPLTTYRERSQVKSVIRPTYQTLRASPERAVVLTHRTSAQMTATLRHSQQIYYLERRTFL